MQGILKKYFSIDGQIFSWIIRATGFSGNLNQHNG